MNNNLKQICMNIDRVLIDMNNLNNTTTDNADLYNLINELSYLNDKLATAIEELE